MLPKHDYVWIFLLLSILSGQVVKGGEYCTYRDNNGYNRYIYCDGNCCSSEDDHCCANYVGLIVGCVIGGVIILAVVITVVVVVCKKHHGKKGRVIQPSSRTITTHQTQAVYSTHFTAAEPPPYSYVNPYQNQYGGVAGPSFIPPPAYPGPPMTKLEPPTYTDPNGVARPLSINVQPSSSGQSDPAYPPMSS